MVLQNLSLYKIKRRLKLTTQAARLTTYSRINTLFFLWNLKHWSSITKLEISFGLAPAKRNLIKYAQAYLLG